jgi:outer membrane lipoprotein carrier protein
MKNLTFGIISVLLSSQISGLSYAYAEVKPDSLQSQTMATADDARKALRKKIVQLQPFQSEFKQQVFDEQGQLLQQSQGRLALSQPNKLHWHVTSPDESLIVSDGETLWYYDPFVEQVTLYRVGSALANTPILLLTDNSDRAWQHYQVIQLSRDSFSITANDVNSQVKQLTISFSAHQVVAMELIDATGQRSVIQLEHHQPLSLDKQTIEQLFHFTVPDGVTVDDQR